MFLFFFLGTGTERRAHSMEIGSAYALQVCLLQIPAMVAFSAWYDPVEMGKVADTFTCVFFASSQKNLDPPLNVRFSLIFPRWDVIVIILSIFLLTYTYIEAKANYHRGSILVLRCAVSLSDQASDTEREFHAAISCLPLGSSSHHSPLETAVTTVFLAPYSPYALLLSRCACFGLRPLPSNTPKPVGLFVIYIAQHYRALWR